jgi:PAT family beta-lactamase induction signal transducer AmpG
MLSATSASRESISPNRITEQSGKNHQKNSGDQKPREPAWLNHEDHESHEDGKERSKLGLLEALCGSILLSCGSAAGRIGRETMDKTEGESSSKKPWMWVPSLYFAQGIPYVMVMTVSAFLYKRLGVSNADITLYTSWLYLPWVVKPLWSPVVELAGLRRWWIVATQLLLGAGLAAVALAIPGPAFFRWTLALFWLLAFTSATHDVASDGFYLLGLNERQQALFVGVRSAFYRLAMIAGQGLLVMLAGTLENRFSAQGQKGIAHAWSLCFLVVGGCYIAICAWHSRVLPRPASDIARPAQGLPEFLRGFLITFRTFFAKPGVGKIVAFILLYRFPEAQLLKVASLFLLDKKQAGGLGLSTGEVGFVYGTVGVICLTAGGLLGGFIAAKQGWRRWLWPMAIAINLPNLVYVYLAYAAPQNFVVINICVGIEQFGYGLGFTAFMLYLMEASAGPYPTAHYAICTGLMALGMMVPGMFSGQVEQLLGYKHFFVWIMVATIPSFVATALISGKHYGNAPAATV